MRFYRQYIILETCLGVRTQGFTAENSSQRQKLSQRQPQWPQMEGLQQAQMVLFGPVGRHEDLHTEQHEGPLRAKAWSVFYFARSGGRRGCQGTNPLSILLWVLYLGASNEKAQVGFSHIWSLQVWLPFLPVGDRRIQPPWVLLPT